MILNLVLFVNLNKTLRIHDVSSHRLLIRRFQSFIPILTHVIFNESSRNLTGTRVILFELCVLLFLRDSLSTLFVSHCDGRFNDVIL